VSNKMTLSLKGTVHNVGLLAAGFERERKNCQVVEISGMSVQFRVAPALKLRKS